MQEKGVKSVFLKPIVREKRIANQTNIVIAFLLTILFILIQVIGMYVFDLRGWDAGILGFVLIFIYSVLLFFLIEPSLLREIESKELRTRTIEKYVVKNVDKPVIKVVEKIVEKPVIRTRIVEKPVVKTKIIRKIVEKKVPVYIEKKRKKLNIPRYKFVGSSETKRYHTRNCRLGKLIKRSHKVSKNSASYYKARKYKPCKVCILKIKKV